MKIIKEIKDCSECENCKITPHLTADSWERAEDWFCTKLKVFVAKYHEWHDKEEIPDNCPIKY